MYKKNKSLLLLFLPLLTCFSWTLCRAEEHVISRGETCLQIAIDHDLTMEQLQRLNPGVDLEMMIVGDILIIPDEGVSFDDFIARRYAEVLQVTGNRCEIMADGAALCFLQAENISGSPLFDVRFTVNVRGQNGSYAQSQADIPLMQILPGEKLPLTVTVPGDFDTAESVTTRVENLSVSDKLQSSFRIPESFFTVKNSFPPDHISGTSTIEFTAEGIAAYSGKKINVLAAAYDAENNLIGVRSLYTDFYPRLDITVYSNGRPIGSVELRLEAY